MVRLRTTPPPWDVQPGRWAEFRADAERVLHRAPELRAAGWDALDVFGLHSAAPGSRVDAAGVAWLLRGREVGRITRDAVEILLKDGAMLRAYRMGQGARLQATLAWERS